MSERECNNSSCDKSSCEGCPSRQQPQSFQVEANEYSCIRRVIGVVSGKGGVGKSMVTASLANYLASKGYKVGILDADITGPSIPKMYGVHGPAEATEEEGITPCYTENGIALMSINLLLPDEAAPVIWRGPIIANVVKQFWTDVIWGDLDYLLVDMPPGTGDVPLTVFQSLPVNEIVMVTSPQDLVQLIVKKALHMAEQMKIPVKGIIENYSYFKCPDCGKEIRIFGKSHIDEEAAKLGIKVLGKMPIEPSFAEASDRGEFHTVKNPYLEIDFE
ncbi:MAG: Mrp/NBP35 family ATP-binding protein [Lachnospiraceae bacterium]|jgi:Mrp family chromosome partitioning ATPase|nr:Mrp/NBP35 family ATP-binding protein [Lachnospiraceae bacterium]